MANIDRPKGLEPAGNLLRVTEYKCVAGYAQDLFIGDPVVAIATGRDINIATAGTGNNVLGAIVGIYDADKVALPYWDSGHSGEGYFMVADHPEQIYSIQGDGDTSYLDEDDCNGNVNLVSGSGSTVYYRSGWEINESDTGGSTAGDQLRLIRPVDRPDNTIGIANADWLVRINNLQTAAGIVGAGV